MKKSLVAQLLALAVACSLVGSAHATTYSWTGAVSGDWNNASNWDAFGVPVDTKAEVVAIIRKAVR